MSHNYDVSIEYYMKPASSFTVGFFRKDIKNYRTSTVVILGTDNEFGPEYAGYELRSFANGGDAQYEGVEFDFRQQFPFLPRWLKGLELFGNYTNIYSAEGNFGEAAVRKELVGLITELGNAGVSYTAPRRKFFAQAKLNYRDRYLRSTNAAGVNKSYNELEQTWDFNARYIFSSRYDLELTVRNAFVNPRRATQYTDQHYIQWQEFGAQYSLIFRVRL